MIGLCTPVFRGNLTLNKTRWDDNAHITRHARRQRSLCIDLVGPLAFVTFSGAPGVDGRRAHVGRDAARLDR